MKELETKLYNAVTDNDTELLSELLKEQKIDINFKVQNGVHCFIMQNQKKQWKY